MKKSSLTLRPSKVKTHGIKPEPKTPRPPAPHSQTVKPCDHKYQILENNTETIYAEGKPYLINVSTVFYCEKCLEIKYKMEEISNA